ncbi:MAG TPA: DUF2231 domain-containing protein [Nitrospira sp.]|jgi:uncharacterized membrane protein|nr:DUF2231 domain-containing protein [Nitrospira sp.]
MKSRAGIAGHPIHPMLVPFPIALWIFSLASDFIYLFGFGGPVWKDIALYTIVAGVGGGLAAAVPGYLDYRAITEPLTAKIAERHMIINVSLVLLFSINVLLRLSTGPHAIAPVVLSVVGVAGLAISGWLGGELVYVKGVGVQDQQLSSKAPAKQRAA